MGSQGFYLHNERIYRHPQHAYSARTDFQDYLRRNRANISTLEVGDHVLPTRLRRRTVEQLFDEFNKEQKSTKENLVDLLLYATGILENRFLIINRITDIKGSGKTGRVTLKPYAVFSSERDGEIPIMQKLTYRRSGKMEKTVTIHQLEVDSNLSGSTLAAAAIDKGFAQMSKLTMPGPAGRMRKVTTPIVSQVVQRATRRFFSVLPKRTVQTLENKVLIWTSKLVTAIDTEMAKSSNKGVELNKIRTVIRRALRHSVREIIAKDIAETMMDPMNIAGFAGARYELRKQIEKYMTGRFVERVLNTATNLYAGSVSSKKTSSPDNSKLNKFIRTELDNSIRGLLAGKAEF